MKLIFIVLLFISSAFSQSELTKWGKADFFYRVEDSPGGREYSFHSTNPLNVIIKSITYAYWFLISDLDGDNCPFYPSCSAFMLDAIEEANFIQGVLMFSDRFTRDASFIGRNSRYPKHKAGKLYDPAYLYDLKYHYHIPPSKVVANQ